ncbi:MAG: hypothetical protein SOR93_09305 [Clostridiales Family XIII bacterium]|nr:hypothetical protein [Clostridiales Family XIII bacterium]
MIKLSQILLKIGQFIKESKVNYATYAGISNELKIPFVEDMGSYAINTAPDGVSAFYTGAPTKGVPGQCLYSVGIIMKRSSTNLTIVLPAYGSSNLYVNTLLNGTWYGWRAI